MTDEQRCVGRMGMEDGGTEMPRRFAVQANGLASSFVRSGTVISRCFCIQDSLLPCAVQEMHVSLVAPSCQTPRWSNSGIIGLCQIIILSTLFCAIGTGKVNAQLSLHFHLFLCRSHPLHFIHRHAVVFSLPFLPVQAESLGLGLRNTREQTHLQDDLARIRGCLRLDRTV